MYYYAPSRADLICDLLVLRTWTPAEVSAVLDDVRPPHWADGFPTGPDREVVRLFAEHPDWLTEFGHRQMVDRASGLVVGAIGLFWPPDDGVFEVGYGVAPSARGRGFATEAVATSAAHALSVAEVHTVTAHVEPDNKPSVRALEKAGFTVDGADPERGTIRYFLRA
jgi:RimJ/RimL family protein N-acetyltransferase